MNRRLVKLNKNLQKVLMEYFIRKMKTPLPGLISVKESAMAKDMKSAKVFLSVMGEEDFTERVYLALEEERFVIQKTISRCLKMKFCPRINFFVNYVPLSLSPSLPEEADTKEKVRL